MVSSAIKQHTQAAHISLEKIVVQRLKNIKSEADYANLLKYFYAYFDALEKAAAQYIKNEILPDHASRRKAGRLLADIEDLGADTDELPNADIPQVNNARQAMGALYVMEGSILGGKLIVQMLAKAGITKGVSFFSGYGDNNGTMWEKFITALNKVALSTQEEREVQESATATFANFEQAFKVEMPAVSQN